VLYQIAKHKIKIIALPKTKKKEANSDASRGFAPYLNRIKQYQTKVSQFFTACGM
jgi:hypothetical protein